MAYFIADALEERRLFDSIDRAEVWIRRTCKRYGATVEEAHTIGEGVREYSDGTKAIVGGIEPLHLPGAERRDGLTIAGVLACLEDRPVPAMGTREAG